MKKLLTAFLLLSNICLAQSPCIDNKQFLKQILQIKNADSLTPSQKLTNYIVLEKKYALCKTVHDTIWVKLNNYKGIANYSLNNLSEAIKLTEKASVFAEKHRKTKPTIYAQMLDNLGFYHYMSNNFEKSNEYYYKEIAFSKDSLKIADCYNTIATTTYLFGDFQKSINTAEKGLPFAKNSKSHLANLFNIISNNYRDLGFFEKSYNSIKLALKYYLESEKEDKKKDDYSHGIYALNIGNDLMNLNQYSGAMKYFKLATSLFEKAGRYDKVIQNGLTNQGHLFEQTKEWNEAKKIYAVADKLFIAKFPNAKDGAYSRIYGNLAKINANEKDFELAIKNYKKAFAVFPSFDIENKSFTAFTFRFLKDKSILQDILTDYGNCMKAYFLQTKQLKYLYEANRIFRMADNVVDAMRFEHTGTQSKYFWRKQTRSVYENAIETCYLLKDYEKAFYFFEKSRAVMLNDKLNELGAKQSLSETDRQEERTFIQKINELNASIENAKNQVEKDKINAKLIDLQEKQEKFIKSLETKNPAYYQLKYNNTTTTLKQFQQYLATSGQSDGFAMGVEYFMGDSATYAIVVSPNSVSLEKLNYNAANTQRFLEFCSKDINTKAEFSQFLAVSSAIYKSLVQPLSLPKGRLIISQDGVFLPFEALSKSATKPEYLLYKFAISYTYSAQFLLKDTQKTTFWPQNKFLGIAPVNFVQKLSPLKGSVESLDKIAKNYFWSSKFVEQQGNKKAFLDNAKNHQIVQIYTHAFADSNETEPRIHFADSTLKVSELSVEQQFKTNLLVLSACKTAVGKVAAGEGVLSLARGFSMAGIPSTITSLWSIGDTDTYTLTELFYQSLNEGFPKDVALQKAKIAFRASKKNTLPNAWAGMVLIGDSSTINSDYGYVWVFLGIILIAIVWFWRKKENSTV